MARSKSKDPNDAPPVKTDETDESNATGSDDDDGGGDGDDEDDDDDDEEEVAGQLADHDGQLDDLSTRLAHVEDILHGLLLHGGEVYVGAGTDRLKLAEHIASRY